MPSSASASPRPGTPTTTQVTSTHPAYTLLAKAHAPEVASQIFTDKIKSKPLLLNPGTSSDKRALRRHIRLRKKTYFLRKQKPRPLSAKEKRANGGIYAVPLGKNKKAGDGKVSYDIYRQLNHLWNGYMLEILGVSGDQQTKSTFTVNIQSQGSLLASADFHGAELEVVRCNDVGKVGMKGIVVRDTKYTFVIVTPDNKVRMIMKKGTVFRYFVRLPRASENRDDKAKMNLDVDVNDQDKQNVEKEEDGNEDRRFVFELHGSQFEYRPAERANRKFKWRIMDYL